MAQTFSIGHVAKATGVAAKTIRYYEDVGVLPPPRRTTTGYRQYDDPALQRVAFVRRARAFGLTIQHVKALTAALNAGLRHAVRPRLFEMLRAQRSTVRSRIAELQRLEQDLDRVLRRPPVRARQRRNGCRCLEVEGRE